MDIETFGKSPSGKVIEVGQGEAAYRAFVPNPLPPHLEPSLELMQALSKADRSLGELAGLGRTIPNPHVLITPFIRREAVLSSRIEGTEADITDLYAFEAGQPPLPGLRPPPPQSDVQEVSNYVVALEYGFGNSVYSLRELCLKSWNEMKGSFHLIIRYERFLLNSFISRIDIKDS